MDDQDFFDVLREFDDKWNRMNEDGSLTLPEGDYQFKVDSAKLQPSKKDDRLFFVIETKVAGGEYEGTPYNHVREVSEKNLPFIKKDLHALGLDLEYLSELPRKLEEIIDVVFNGTVKVTVKGDKTYTNLYINQVVGKIDSDIPF